MSRPAARRYTGRRDASSGYDGAVTCAARIRFIRPAIPARLARRIIGLTRGLLLAGLLAAVPAPAAADVPPTCDGPFNGRPVPAQALATLLDAHGAWLAEYRPVLLESIRAMSQFRDVVATLDSADYLRAMADPRRADLCGAHLSGVQLAGADLPGVDLTGADLTGADLTGADLTGADVTGADLTGAGLAGADLTGADLTGTKLAQANLFGTVFEPFLSGRDEFREGGASAAPQGAVHHTIGFPDTDSMAQAHNLDRMLFTNSPTPMQRLKDAFATRGHRTAARQVMASLQWAEDLRLVRKGSLGERLGGAVRLVMLGITCSYGAAPGRTLGWLLCLILAFTIPYTRIITLESTGSGNGPEAPGAAPGGVLNYALSGSNAALGLALLAPWLVLSPGPAWFRRLGLAGHAEWGGWAVALLVIVPILYVACSALLGAAVVLRARLGRGRPSTLLTLLTSTVLIAGLLSIPSLALVTASSGRPSALGAPLVYVTVWVLLLLALMHTAGTYAQGRGGTILARWEAEHEGGPLERVDAAFFSPHAEHGTATGGADGPTTGDPTPGDRLRRYLSVTKGALWFSLIISCRIGWKDLSLGTWLTHIQPRPYNLMPTGGLRVICGIQSVIGSYLLALLLLTYFRPLFTL
jgi:hypothetical protein